MDAHFHNVQDELTAIKEQTTRTNSRVNHVEDDIKELKKSEAAHLIKCPAMPKIESIETNLLEYKMFKKYPKLGMVLIIVFVILSLVSISKTMKVSNKVDNTEMVLRKAINDQEGVSKTTRGGYVKYNDRGLSDSIKIR
jgi:uncharacterized protein YoxC